MASEEQKSLAAYIKNVHKTLRLQSRLLGSDEAWVQHCQNTNILEVYAENMQKLATEFWDKNNLEESDLCRLQWVINQSQYYFYKEGQEKASLKEKKLSEYYFKSDNEAKLNDLVDKSILSLLDVGSCYNPFSRFQIFDVTAIDLMPASKDVYKCDFLSVEICKTMKVEDNVCHTLPETYFDIIVFSLLLEYLPSSNQRVKCCEKAYDLLQPGGLLFILTPDSKHATANACVMKSWRCSLASIGFLLVRYQKLKHLHCMAYRKCYNPEVPKFWFNKQMCNEAPENLMYIPQDFHYYDDICDSKVTEDRSDTDNKLLADMFSDLPDFNVIN